MSGYLVQVSMFWRYTIVFCLSCSAYFNKIVVAISHTLLWDIVTHFCEQYPNHLSDLIHIADYLDDGP